MFNALDTILIKDKTGDIVRACHFENGYITIETTNDYDKLCTVVELTLKDIVMLRDFLNKAIDKVN